MNLWVTNVYGGLKNVAEFGLIMECAWWNMMLVMWIVVKKNRYLVSVMDM